MLDDATDHTVDVDSEFGDEVDLVARRENKGAAVNRNQIIDYVSGAEIIHFIDADMGLGNGRNTCGGKRPVGTYDLTWAKLVHIVGVDFGECFGEVVG